MARKWHFPRSAYTSVVGRNCKKTAHNNRTPSDDGAIRLLCAVHITQPFDSNSTLCVIKLLEIQKLTIKQQISNTNMRATKAVFMILQFKVLCVNGM